METKPILLEALDGRWKKFRAELKNCREEFSEEAVHDLRVATRRLLALFDLLRHIIHHNRIQKIRRDLKDHLNDLNELRDVQVLLADVSEELHETPALKFFQEHLVEEEKRFMRHARKLVKARDDKSLKKRVEKMRDMVQELPDATLSMQVMSAADDAFARVLQAYSAMDAENVASIHKLRVAFKRFRYTVEIVHPLLEAFPSANFESMHGYQSRMGDIQDMEVALQRVADMEIDPAAEPDLKAMYVYYAARLRAAVLKFLEDKGEVFVFWRNSPDQSFPWEK